MLKYAYMAGLGIAHAKPVTPSMGQCYAETGKFVEFKRFSKKFKRDDFMKVAVIQMSPVFLDKSATWEKLKLMILEAIEEGASVIT